MILKQEKNISTHMPTLTEKMTFSKIIKMVESSAVQGQRKF